MVDEITKATMIAIIARWQVAYFSQEAQKAIREEADKKITEFSKVLVECRNTAKSLGYDRDDEEQWKAALQEFLPGAQELYTKARPPELPHWNWMLKKEPLPEPEVTGPHLPPPPFPPLPSLTPPPPPSPARPSIRQIVLDRLEQAGDAGDKAVDIRKYIETTYNEVIHEKTVGMTLYRLLQDALVRRQGHTWFLVPQKIAESKNPGGETPGLIEMAN